MQTLAATLPSALQKYALMRATCDTLATRSFIDFPFESAKTHGMDLREAIATLPADSPYRALLAAIGSTDPAVVAAATKARSVIVRPYWEPPTVTDSATALIVLDAMLDLESAERSVTDVIFSLIGSAHPDVIDRIRKRYGSAPVRLRLDLLTVIASAATRDAAATLVELITAHGWPAEFHDRFAAELRKNESHADVLFPALLAIKGGPDMLVGDFLLDCLRREYLAPDRLADTQLARELPLRIKALTRKLPDEDAARSLALQLDLAGFIGDVLPALREAAELENPWPAMFAVASLVRRGEVVAPQTIESLAKDHALRNLIFSLLRDMGRADLFPAHLATRDNFACADMVQWLSHPGELGHPPADIEQMTVFERGNGVLYVWRFKSKPDAEWTASVSGPYAKDAPPGPLSGTSTFSRFELWDTKTPEAHADAVLATLAEWEKAHASRDR